MTSYEFYRQVAKLISSNRNRFGGLDVSDIKIIEDNHPAIVGMKNFIKVPTLAAVQFSGNRFNNFYLPEGIILTSKL
jgi:hypothetical protein